MFSSIPDVDDWGDDDDNEGDDIKQRKAASSSLSGKATSSLKDTKKKAHTLVKSLSAQMLSAVNKRTDSVFNSPGMSKGLLEQEGEDEPDSKSPKKKKKKKNKEKDNESSSSSSKPEKKKKKKKNKDDESLSSSSKSVGSILRQGIRFSSFEDFCSFVDGGSSKDKKKRKEREMLGSLSSPEAPPRKRLKMESGGSAGGKKKEDGDYDEDGVKAGAKSSGFDIAKLKSFLGGQKSNSSTATTTTEEGDSKAKSKLKSSRFRYLNELLYTQPGSQSFKMFRGDVDAFKTYHEGYMEQARKWPQDPLQTILTAIVKNSDKHSVIADFGCGEARLALALSSSSTPKIKVYSFDFVALNDRVTSCDMSKTPLEDETVDVVVFCLSLMGTNLRDYLKEANRVLRMGGILKIAEVESRFTDISVEQFSEIVQKFGFELKWKEVANKGFFVFMDFKKVSHVKKKAPEISLKPCIYKKR